MKLYLDYEIREANIGDAEDITEVLVQSWKETYVNIISNSFLDNIEYTEKKVQKYKEAIASREENYTVATFKGKVVGFCNAKKFQIHKNQILNVKQLTQRNERGEIYLLYLLSEHQKKGLGTMLFYKAAKWLKEKQLVPFLVWVFKDNIKARSFYTSLGGKVVDEILLKIDEVIYSEVAYKFDKEMFI